MSTISNDRPAVSPHHGLQEDFEAGRADRNGASVGPLRRTEALRDDQKVGRAEPKSPIPVGPAAALLPPNLKRSSPGADPYSAIQDLLIEGTQGRSELQQACVEEVVKAMLNVDTRPEELDRALDCMSQANRILAEQVEATVAYVKNAVATLRKASPARQQPQS